MEQEKVNLQKNGNAMFQIDLEKVIAEKVKRPLPRWLVRYIIKVAHQDDINDCIAHAQYPSGINFFHEALKYLDITFEVRGLENLPAKDHPCIFAGNHPLGGPEALIIGEMMRQQYGESFRVPVNNILGYFHPLKEFFVPVNTMSSRQSRDIGERMNAMFESPYQVLVFPAGKCSRREHGRVTEQPWKKMFITQARRYCRDVVPIHSSGRNSRFFYTLTSLSKAIGLKFNIGMFYLVDELFKQRHRKFVLTIGRPIPYTTFDRSRTDAEWAEAVRREVAILEQGNGEKGNMGIPTLSLLPG